MIGEEQILKSVTVIDEMEEGALEKYIEGITMRQENLTTFNISTALEFNNEAVANYSMYFYAIIFKAFELEYDTVKHLSEEEINSYLESIFYPALDKLYKENQEDNFKSKVGEALLLDFLSNDIRQLQENDPTVDEVAISQLFILTSAVTGLMTSAI